MLQVVKFDTQLQQQIIQLENQCEEICQRLEKLYAREFENLGMKLTVECLRTLKGQLTSREYLFEENYQSSVEIGIINEDYFPNASIPLWKCKREMFQVVGYLTREDAKGIERKILMILREMMLEGIEE